MGALHAAADRLLRCRSSTMSPHRLRRGASHPSHRRTQFTHAFNLDTTLDCVARLRAPVLPAFRRPSPRMTRTAISAASRGNEATAYKAAPHGGRQVRD